MRDGVNLYNLTRMIVVVVEFLDLFVSKRRRLTYLRANTHRQIIAD